MVEELYKTKRELHEDVETTRKAYEGAKRNESKSKFSSKKMSKIQEAYSEFAEDEDLDSILELIEVSGVHPNDDILQRAYERCMIDRSGRSGYFNDLQELIEITGIEPKKETVQKAFKIYMEEGALNDLEGVMDATGIKPARQIVLDQYKEYINEGDFKELLELKRLTEIEPPENYFEEE